MGTTLTGTTPQDTYDSLIKVTDNGPIGTSLKTLTDGLGNDTALGLSNRGLKVNQSATLITDTATLCHFTNNFLYLRGGSAGLSIGDDAFSNSITLADNADIAFEAGSAERMRIASAGNVGIGTSTPDNVLDLGAAASGRGLTFNSYSNVFSSYSAGDLVLSNNFYGSTATDTYLTSTTATFGAAGIRVSATSGASTGGIIQLFANAAAVKTAGTAFTPTEICRVTPNGLTFNGDTAAANALDDYEEGTFTPTVVGTTGTATYTTREGHYTKIGRQVTVTFFISFQKASIAGSVTLASLPFTVGNLGNQYPQAAILIDNLASAYDNPILQLNNGDTSGFLLINNGSTVSHAAMNASQLGAGTMTFRGTATYFV